MADGFKTQAMTMRTVMLLLLTIALALPAAPAAAVRTTEIGFVDIELAVTGVERRESASGKLGIVIDVIGAGVIACDGQQACIDAGLEGADRDIEATVGLTLDAERLRATGRIVIDVISAGVVSIRFKGSVRGTLAQTAPGIFDVGLSVSARADRGDRIALALAGSLNRGAGVLSPLTGDGIVSMDDVDQI